MDVDTIKKEVRLSFIMEGKKFTWYKLKITRDGSSVMIPAPQDNRNGTRITSHPSGIVNVRNKSGLDIYNLREKVIETFREILPKAFVPQTEATAAIVVYALPKNLEKRFITVNGNELTVNWDALMDHADQLIEVYDLDKEESPEDFKKDFPEAELVIFTDKKLKRHLRHMKGTKRVLWDADKFLELWEKTELGRHFKKQESYSIYKEGIK